MDNRENEFIKFSILIPKQAINFAKKQGIRLDVQELTLSAIAGYFRTFANISPDSKFPWARSHRIAKLIEEFSTIRETQKTNTKAEQV